MLKVIFDDTSLIICDIDRRPTNFISDHPQNAVSDTRSFVQQKSLCYDIGNYTYR